MRSIFLVAFFCQLAICAFGQLCGTPGLDGSGNISASINTYFPVLGNVVLSEGSKTVSVAAIPPDDSYGNNFGTVPVKAGDMLLLIQMQDAVINSSNDASYGAGNSASGPDNLGGTGFIDLGNTGLFEYVIATNAVPLSGGQLTFKAVGSNGGTINTYVNQEATATRGKRTFQVVRIPQYSNLVLSSDIKTPPFNGVAGGIIAFDVAGSMDFGGYTIDASARGFRGGYGPVSNSDGNISDIYMIPSTDYRSVGKGEGIAGTPRFMWDGYNQVDNLIEGLPGGSYGKGAPGNAGGGGNDHNSGGGGGANGGFGGVGGNGTLTVNLPPQTFPNGGRPGSPVYSAATLNLSRIIMGGGGGGGDANNALNGVKGGVGGGIILINVGSIIGKGTILANGGDGAAGAQGTQPDGAGGGGAGGSVYIKVSNPDPNATLTIEARGGNGGNTRNDIGTNEHGPGGGGAGGLIFYTMPAATVNLSVAAGNAGRTNSGAGSSHGAEPGQEGLEIPFLLSQLPAYLQGGGPGCFPAVKVAITHVNSSTAYRGAEVVYHIKVANSGGGNAGGVQIETLLPAGIRFKSAEVTYLGDSGGPSTLANLASSVQRPLLGDFNISPGHEVLISLTALVDCGAPLATYNASVQALYLDPSRTVLDPDRRITSAINAFPGAKTTFENIMGAVVPGYNFDGSAALSDNITLIASQPFSNNTISTPADQINFCVDNIGDAIDPQTITGSLPSGDIGVYTYQWQVSSDNIMFSDIAGATSINFDPPAISVTSYYRRVVRSSACVSPLLSNAIKISVAVRPIADFDLPDFCLNDGTATFINKSTIADGSASQLTYLWSFGEAAATSTSRNGSHDYQATGVFTVSLTVTSMNGCQSVKTRQFTVNGSNPIADYAVLMNGKLCSGRPVYFEDRASVTPGEITRIEWFYDYDNFPEQVEIDEEPGLRSSPKTYSHIYPPFTGPLKNFTVLMKAFSGESCVSELRSTITLYASPQIEFSAMADVCFSDNPFQLTAASETAGAAGTGRYSGLGVNSAGWFNPSTAGVGTHTITYTFQAATGGCVDTRTQTIAVRQNPVAENETVEILLGGSIELPVMAALGLSYTWTPALHLSRADILNPIASPLETTVYTLTVTDVVTGCSSQGTITVIVHEVPEIPNTFTPNGDGTNDYWVIKKIDTYTDCVVRIFNRFGSEVFSSKGYDSPWDGTFNGTPLPIGAYYYLIDPKKGKSVISGSITILR